ncbi:MAG: hypothetical protein KIT31_35355 [Deltaproteobacteria bacterium]|nr:hypothetical protein [Deltaproteobacteria bacterium]
MQGLIDVIRASVSSGATSEQKAAGAQACRTILAALASEPGKPIALPGIPAPSPQQARLSIDQVLDLAIARLSMIASEREAAPQPQPVPQGLRVPRMPAVPRATPRTMPKVPNAVKTPTRKP